MVSKLIQFRLSGEVLEALEGRVTESESINLVAQKILIATLGVDNVDRVSTVNLEEVETLIDRKLGSLQERLQKVEAELEKFSIGTQASETDLEERLRECQRRCTHLENENNRLTRLGQDYSQETVGRLSNKYTKALQDIEHWKETAESYKRQAAKIKTERDELDAEVERLTAQTGDMDLTIQTQAQEIAELKDAIAADNPIVDNTVDTVDSSSDRLLTQGELAKRLGTHTATLTKNRSKPNFAEWSRAKDPEQLVWRYLPEVERYASKQ